MSFRALFIEKTNDASTCKLETFEEKDLPPEGDVDLAVEYSTLNYKDGLAITGKSPVIRKFPLVPGIDGAGVVRHSRHPNWKEGDRVLFNGYGMGELTWGGLTERTRVSGDHLVRIPDAFDTRQAMAIGTAGFTAMLCILALEEHGIEPDAGDILVTGATGGVGSIAVAVLSNLGYRVVASTGKAAEKAYLERLGAAELLDRATLSEPGKPLQKERWAGVVDAVGSHTLVNAVAQTKYGGAVAACGLAQGMDFPASVAPFILRAVTLYGICSVNEKHERREKAWARLAQDLDLKLLEELTEEVGLEQSFEVAQKLMDGQVKGRFIVNVRD